MAIKGKGRTRSKPVARGPRPVPVQVKPPVLARRWLQVTAAFAGGALLVLAGLWSWTGLQRDREAAREERQRQEQVTAMQQYRADVESALSPLGSPGPNGFDLLPDLSRRLERLAAGETPTGTAGAARSAERLLRGSAKALEGLDVAAILGDRGFGPEVIVYAIGARDDMARGLRLLEQVARAVGRAAGLDGTERARLVEMAVAVEPLAREAFDDGYRDYLQALAAVGIFALPPPPGPEVTTVPGAEGA